MKKFLKIVLIVVVAIVILGVVFGGGDSGNKSTPKRNESASVSSEVTITYSQENIDDMLIMLDEYPLQAEDYTDKYIEVTGTLGTVDTDGKYFTMEGSDEWSLDNIHWDMEDAPDVYEFIKNTKVGTSITVKGQITDVGEIMSYMGVAHEVH